MPPGTNPVCKLVFASLIVYIALPASLPCVVAAVHCERGRRGTTSSFATGHIRLLSGFHGCKKVEKVAKVLPGHGHASS